MNCEWETEALEGDLEQIAALVMHLGEVQRGTLHPDGVTPETDTTHTVMLALCAVYLGRMEKRELDLATILLFALVHDLVEAYAGDTVTLRRLDVDAQADRDRREAEALERIRADLPWLAMLIEVYERQDTVEAQLVKLVDKMLPKFTHGFNDCAALRDYGMGLDELSARLAEQQQAHGSPLIPLATEMFRQTSNTLIVRYQEVLDAP